VSFQIDTPTALIDEVMSEPLAKYPITEIEAAIRINAWIKARELDANAHAAKSTPTAITITIATSAHLDEEAGITAKIGSVGIAPKLWVNGETKVPAPTAKPVPVKNESVAIARFGK
jgi:hypothetical protein